MRRARALALTLSGIGVVTIASHAGAQVLHERVLVGSLTCAGGICSSETGVKAIEQDGQVLFAPTGGAQPAPGEQVFSPQPAAPVEIGGPNAGSGGGDHPPDRRDVIRSDRDTGPEGQDVHYYHAVFNPEIFPYKRMTALDAVRIAECLDRRPSCDDEVLEVFDRQTLQLLPVVGPRREADRDAFWGSIVVDLEPNRWVPIPSVAPDTRILDYKSEPRVEVQFARDAADNVFVRSPSGGRHRLTWLSDAPVRYFGGDLPPGVRLSDEPQALLRPVPERLRARVQTVLRHAGIHVTKSMPLEVVLSALVNYFRAFESGTLPPPSGSSYLDLALAQKGCCRHRSYAFAITAMAVGIPVRYVENEVHVFVEVYLPTAGWRRINLGGAPLNEELLGGDGKTMYREKGGDPFPRPEPFLRTAAPPPKGVEKLASGSSAANQSGGGSGSGGNGAGANGAGGNGGSGKPRRAVFDENAPPTNEPIGPLAQPDKRAPTAITVELAERSTFRGETVDVSGSVTATGADAAGLPVEIFLEGPSGQVRVAETATGADGRYRVTVEVPRDLPLGDHRVSARTRGDEKRAPSSTRH
ncbi:MAG TPA: transglutaminase domain-containing protein [Polyangia bacterium]|nr:transglutaminase domain-containing protein [Polyangia bacterium]